MIHTYSVIIQSSKTQEAFSQYQSLFAEALNSNRIGVCKWNEAGTTIETALPELSGLTDDKDEWRAIIVRYVDDHCMSAYESTPRNPYDFLINQSVEDEVFESEIPLVRLTQMLGGIPPLETKFRAEVIKENHKAARTIYIPVVDEERERKHQALVRKYRFDGKMPSSILIVSVRKRIEAEENLGRVWLSHKESESSEFWKRNQYPSICRFMVCDFEMQGPIQKEADDFNFWFSVMLLAVNDIDSATLQAYRLYTIKTRLDHRSMSDTFQSMADRLRDARKSIDKEIRKDIENQVVEEEDLPEYRVDIPVVLKSPDYGEREVPTETFRLFSPGTMTEVSRWEQERHTVERGLADVVHSAERVLDQTAGRMRGNLSLVEDEVMSLNKYQVEDLQMETRGLYQNIISTQGELPTDKIAQSEEIQEAAEKVRATLVGRVTKRPATTAVLIAVALMVLSSIPAVVNMIKRLEHSGDPVTLAFVLLAAMLLIMLCGLGVLCWQKMKLNRVVDKYNREVQDAFNELSGKADDYSVYMSAIGSYARGMSYLRLSERKKYHEEVVRTSKHKHIKAINIMLNKLQTWSRAYRLNVDFTTKRPETRIEINTVLSPADNKLYMFETGKSYTAELNHSGMTIYSPFSFASRLEILREELYDD